MLFLSFPVPPILPICHQYHLPRSTRYLDLLIGPYPADKALYEERSPIHAADRIVAPVAIFQA